MKEEMYRLKTYNAFDELEADVAEYIDFYNTKRVSLSMGLKIPS
ncbi:IS3 family transposase [Peptostreptococcus porci]